MSLLDVRNLTVRFPTRHGAFTAVEGADYTATSGSIGLGFAIPSNDVAFMLDQIRQYGRPHLGWLGMKIQTVNADMSEALKIPMQSGAIISEVTPGSPADEAGLKVGDIIQAFADEQVIEAAREQAAAENSTLNEQFRLWLEQYARQRRAARAMETVAKMQRKIDTGGRKLTREEMNER